MKATIAAVLALVAASTLAQPILMPQESQLNARDVEVNDLEARFNFGKLLKGAASLIFKRDDGSVLLVARGPFDDDYLEARDYELELDQRALDDADYVLEARTHGFISHVAKDFVHNAASGVTSSLQQQQQQQPSYGGR